MKFANRSTKGERVQQNFDKDNIYIKKAGKKLNVYKMIQAANEDLNIYDVIEKYGSLKKMEMDVTGIYGDYQRIMGLRDIIEANKQADVMWMSLPLDVRNKFKNNKQNFMQNGESYLKELYDLQNNSKNPTSNSESDQSGNVASGSA